MAEPRRDRRQDENAMDRSGQLRILRFERGSLEPHQHGMPEHAAKAKRRRDLAVPTPEIRPGAPNAMSPPRGRERGSGSAVVQAYCTGQDHGNGKLGGMFFLDQSPAIELAKHLRRTSEAFALDRMELQIPLYSSALISCSISARAVARAARRLAFDVRWESMFSRCRWSACR